ncbi:site-specific DNA-methyltransferase [Photorhabdus sp. CRCIA-P01]|uniref:site-specific DNA-methyltransferase n=1 Tax=Photorhabdus sp. CRCIA-P01 TaxID=2019570 RepID=UPI000E59B4C1|nr:site-specific DNA-methyltransferase [Photorhabdus sp. CRCIA-P01]
MSTAVEEYTTHYTDANNCIEKLQDKYREKLLVNQDLNRKMVSFQANKSEPIFRWFYYREGFSKQLIEYILDSLGARTGQTLLDPFAGTGAAPFVAETYKQMNGIAVELMPVGAFFIQCRNAFAQLSSEEIIDYAKRALNSREEWLSIKPEWTFGHLRITKDAFSQESELELCKYKSWSSQQLDETFRLFLDFVAFSILEKFSFTRKDGQYLRWDYRSPRFFNKEKKTNFNKGTIYSFFEALSDKLKNIIDDLNHAEDLFEESCRLENNQIKIFQGSVLEKIDELADESVDIVITSPPYCNRYDYTRTYALELAYLGIGEDELRELRQTLLTCTVENKPKQFEWIESSLKNTVDTVFSKQECLQKIIAFLEDEAKRGALNNKGIKTMVEGYFYDSAIHLAQVARKMKKGAKYVMVNDNVRYNGLEVPVDLLLSEIASEFGLKTDVIWVLPKGKGNSSQQMKKHGRSELRKCIYIWEKE